MATTKESKTFNKDNWSGQEVTMEFDGTTWTQYGYEFELVPVDDAALGRDGFRLFNIVSKSWADPLGSVFEDRKTAPGEFFASAMSIQREADDPRVAAAKLLFNII